MKGYYILRDKKPVPATTIEWVLFMEKRNDCVVKRTNILGMYVSTVFLGMDHSFLSDATPILFETMIFKGPLDQEYQTRYTSWKQAVRGHWKAVGYVIGYKIKSLFK